MVLAAVGQICSTASMAHNLSQCRTVIQKAVAAGAKAVFLPEASDYIGGSPTESVSLCKPATSSPFVNGLRDLARKHALPINVGIHEPCHDASSKKIRNTLIWIDAKGEIAHRYQKLHLFDMDLSSDGGPKMKESETVEPGNKIETPYSTELGKIGSMICFDLRFPEIALALRRKGANVLLYPSAFMPKTGEAHWHALLCARAIENECWVIASAQVGAHNDKRSSYGHALVVSPWGEVVAELPGWQDKQERGDAWEPEIVTVDIDLGAVEKMRKEVPLMRRTDVYPEI